MTACDGADKLYQTKTPDPFSLSESEGLVHVESTGGPVYFIQVNTEGFEQFAKAYIPDYESTVQALASSILNENVESNLDLQAKLAKDQFLINHILDVLESQDYIQLEKFGDGRVSVYSVSVKLRRAFSA